MSTTCIRTTALRLTAIASLPAVLAFACSDDESDKEGAAGAGGSGGSGAVSTTGGSGAAMATGGSGASAGSGAFAGSGGTSMDAGLDASAGVGGLPIDSGAEGGFEPLLTEVRLIHASSNAPAVDIYIAGDTIPVATNVAYGDATEYLELPPDVYAFDLRSTGAPATDTPAFTTPNLTLGMNEKWSVVAAGDFDSSDADDRFRVLPLLENFDGAPADRTEVRIVHAGFDASTVDVDINNDAPALPELADLARFEASDAAGLELPSGTQLQLGIAANDARITAFTTPELVDQQQVFVIATGEIARTPLDPGGFVLLAVYPDGSTEFIRQNPFVNALHAAPALGTVDVFLGALKVFEAATLGDLETLQAPPGSYTFDLFTSAFGDPDRPAGDPLASATTPELAAGNTYLAVASATAGEPTLVIDAYPDEFLLDLTNARVRAVHAADAPAVDVGTVTVAGTLDTPPLVADLAYREASPAAGLAVSPATVTLGLAPTGNTTTVAEFSGVTLAAGDRTFFVAIGQAPLADGGPVTAPLRLIAIDANSFPPTGAWTATTLSAD